MTELALVSELRLDFDKHYPQKRLNISRVCFIARMLRLTIISVEATKTKNGKHVRIIIAEKIHPVTQILIQALMNSDYAREVYNVIRVFNLLKPDANYSSVAAQRYNVLFYKKLVGGKVVSWEEPDPVLSERLMKRLKKATNYEKLDKKKN
jgi:hypothetical protein